MTPATANQGKGKYRLIAELGRGGMSHVFLAVVQGPGGFNKFQVVKRLRSDLAEDPEFLTMFMEEARLSARINHPNVVQTNEIGHDGQYYFIAMEYLDGQSFEAILRRGAQKGGVPVPVQLRILAEALGGLQHAHDLNDYDGNPLHVVHRDMSPHNLFVTYEGHVKVVDFGIAKAADGTLQTRTGVFKGKCAYMAPEQFLGERVDRRADLFSVGAMLWHTATGKRLWRGLTDIQIYTRLSQGSIPEVRDFNPNVDPRFETIIMRALAPNPDDRYASASELQVDVESYLEALEIRVGAREVGRYTADLFADSRSEIRKAIEKQLRATATTEPVTAEVPALASLVPTGTVDMSPPPRRWSEGEQGADRTGESLQPPPTFALPETSVPSNPPAPFTPGPSLRGDVGHPLPTTTSTSPKRTGPSRGLLLALIAGPIVLLTVILVTVLGRHDEHAEGSIRGASSGSVAAKADNTSAPKQVANATATPDLDEGPTGKLTVNATPSTAPSVPLDRTHPGKPGKPPAAPHPSTTPSASTTATTPDPMALPAVNKPKPPLDESDPWKK
jgi:serine/threonine protein kinase